METRIRLKNLYLVAVIAIGLIGLGIGSTFAMFTASSTINNPIAFSSNLSSENYLAETIEVTVPAFDDKNVEIIISNTNQDSMNYVTWYSPSSNALNVVSSTSNNSYGPSGTLPSSELFTLSVNLRNRSDDSINVTIGVSSNTSSVIIPNDVVQIVNGEFPPLINENAVTYISNLYSEATKTVQVNNGLNYNLAEAVHLMNDRLGSSEILPDDGNIRYYGADSTTNNYLYFNCTDYLNQTSETCELWRIIGVFGDKIKVIRSTPLTTVSWDTSSSTVNDGYGISQWGPSTHISDGSDYGGADLMKLLNEGFSSNQDFNRDGNLFTVNNSLYWDRANGKCYAGMNYNNSSCSFASYGLKENTHSKIASETYYLSASDTASPAASYLKERRVSYSLPTIDDDVQRTFSWVGKVALMYPSDYGYAVDFTKCNVYLSQYNSDAEPNFCVSNNWLYRSGYQRLLSPSSSSSSKVYRINSNGLVTIDVASSSIGIKPVLYLNTDTYFWIGDGTSENPYQLRS